MRFRTPWAVVCAAVTVAGGLTLPLAGAPASAAGCDPMGTTPQWRGEVPSPRSVLGFDLGQREVTTAESDRYLTAVDRSSARVVTGIAARSQQGRPLRYAIVGTPGNVSEEGLARVRINANRLRNP